MVVCWLAKKTVSTVIDNRLVNMNIDEINKDINKATVQNILSFFNSADWSDNLNLDTERLLKDKSYVDDFYEKANSGDNKSQLIMFYVEMINNINSFC